MVEFENQAIANKLAGKSRAARTRTHAHTRTPTQDRRNAFHSITELFTRDTAGTSPGHMFQFYFSISGPLGTLNELVYQKLLYIICSK
jgi:hypothetical protein